MSETGILVTLVGRRLAHNENLGLAYLRAALRGAGIAVSTSYVNDGGDVARAAQQVLEERPDVVGLSLADGGSAFLPLALGEALRRTGYRGHITAGGQFATLARSWLLERYDWLDSVVRLAGERPLVEIAERVSAGVSVHGIAGVSTRAGDGPAARVLDELPQKLCPERDELPEVLGFPAAHISASRGCWGRCQYCGPAALHTLERQEGTRAGIASRILTESGVGGLRRRDLERVCDEMAELWHERGVRYFYFVDEHLLPYDEAEALSFLRRWREGLAARGVGALGIGGMLRADRLTPAIVRDFVKTGLVRVFVGLELATEEEGRRFGRRAPGERELSLVRLFAELGVATVSNLMLVHPYSTPESIARGIDFLERLPTGVFEATRMMVYHGTRLEKTMTEEGRLVGNPLRYGYTFTDSNVERFAEIFARLRGEAFYDYSLACRTHDAYLAFGLARRVAPERVSEGLSDRIDRARTGVNALYVAAYRRALGLALAGGGFAEAAPLVASLAPRVRALEEELSSVEELLMRAAPERGRMFAPMRSAAASAISFALVACGGETSSNAPPKDASSEAGGTGGTVSGGAGGTFSGGAGGTLPAGGTGGTTACTPDDIEPAKQQVADLLGQKVACFSGAVVFEPGKPPNVQTSIYGNAGLLSLRACNSAAGQAAVDNLKQLAESAISGNEPVCIYGGLVNPVVVSVTGGAQSDAQKLADTIKKACDSLLTFDSQFTIVLDATGKVIQVKSDPALAALAQCVQSALSGLSFPCLASFEVCPEYVIVE